MAHETGREFAARKPGNDHGANPPDLADFATIMPLWQAGGGVTTQWVQQSERALAFHVARCRYAESYREMGLGGIGDMLSCNRDGEFCNGYNSSLRLTRTQTLMEGARHCDFRQTPPAKD